MDATTDMSAGQSPAESPDEQAQRESSTASKDAQQPQRESSTASAQQLQQENERLHAQVAALEAELVEVQARTNAAIATWQEQAYWLDRWHLDLNALMRRPGAVELLGALRATRGVWWRVKLLKRRLLGS